MRVTNQSNNYNNLKPYKPGFKQIRPEFMYINSPGYDRNYYWADATVKIIQSTVKKIKGKCGFNDLLDSAAIKYSEACDENIFGAMRYERIANIVYGKYEIYKDRLLELIKQKGRLSSQIVKIDDFPQEQIVLSGLTQSKAYTPTFELSNKNVKIPLTDIIELETPGTKLSINKPEVAILSPYTEYIEPILSDVGLIYENILRHNQNKYENIKPITQDVAKIHWLISQVRPFQRGSAGIADIIAKSIFEAKGIQVSPYKEGINPNMEAFTMSMEEYARQYHTFFTEQLRPIIGD